MLSFPLSDGEAARQADFFFLHTVEQVQGTSVERESGWFYYLALRRLFKGMNFETSQAFYERHLGLLVPALMDSIPTDFDALACAPSCSPETLAPYRDRYLSRSPKVVDLSASFSRDCGLSSTAHATRDRRLHGTTFEASADLCGVCTLLLVDDVLDTGVTIAAMINAVEKNLGRPLKYGVACPLWITHGPPPSVLIEIDERDAIPSFAWMIAVMLASSSVTDR
jgi:hypothetical protein